ncbi:phosphatase PAP2 family protein [Microbacterium foliorum]|uniref:Phosphatidylglycerophosphatase B n=1 Tax=Microbacterium foliorum TaxID=104336 RepID=A0A0F0KP99_9MICO|nr:phosphatase PAP2 family protein [Microbacterium foliorum]AXL13132.1 phosphatase PAP2 family protein [Microbacterium foliorum]KJL21091.1 phosphatidylglycerophosphatase B [Microbacterium foliorum]
MSDAARRNAALLTGISAVVAFVALRSIVAIGGHEPLTIDVWWHDVMAAASSDVGIVIAWVPAVVGGTLGMILVGVALIVLLLRRDRRGDAATLAIAMIAVVALGATMAAVIGRTRPEDSLAESMATSFPSGHTAVATTVVVVLGIALRRRLVWVLGAIWVITMMWSRTYLAAHWLSDVVAGMLEGVGVATLVWVCAEAARDRRAAHLSATTPFPHPDESATTP